MTAGPRMRGGSGFSVQMPVGRAQADWLSAPHAPDGQLGEKTRLIAPSGPGREKSGLARCSAGGPTSRRRCARTVPANRSHGPDPRQTAVASKRHSPRVAAPEPTPGHVERVTRHPTHRSSARWGSDDPRQECVSTTPPDGWVRANPGVRSAAGHVRPDRPRFPQPPSPRKHAGRTGEPATSNRSPCKPPRAQ